MKKQTYLTINLVLFLIFVISVWLNPIVFTHLKYLLILSGIAISSALFYVFQYSKKQGIHIIHKVMLVLAVLISVINVYVYINIENSLSPIQLETTQISVFVLNENEDLEFTKDLELGVSVEIEPTLYESLRIHVENELGFIISPKMDGYDQDLISALYDQNISAIMLDVANLGFLEEEDAKEFLERTKVIFTFEKSTEVKGREPIDDNFKTNAIVFYISGIDHAGDLNWRARSDVNQLVIVNPDTKQISFVSIPRDTYVPTNCLNGVRDKLNHAAVRGIQCSISTIENYLDIPIDYYIRLNFTSFLSIFDIIGPTEIYSHYSFNSGGYSFTKGMNLMDSKQALAFARARKVIPGGDQTRGLHQQEVIKGVFRKLTSPSQIGNIQKVISSTRSFVQTDITPSTITKLLDILVINASQWQLESYVLTGTPATASWPNEPNRFYSVIQHSNEQLREYRQLMVDLRKKD